MEESDEPDQPISAERQEIRKRRRPSQPMVDKSQQTEVTEKRKHLPISQPSGPKATLSIGNIPGSKVNYESLRVSSQLQQTWTKRKRVQDKTDKSLQTDTTVEEKKEETKSVGETAVPEEKPAALGEAVPEFPESVQEVEIAPSRHSVQFKIDRSQQTSCTGDWTMMNIPQKEKVDKEQQTYFSETEIVVIGRPDTSFSKSNEVVQKRKSSGKIFISEHPELQPSTSKDEAIGQISTSRLLFSQQSIKGSLELSEDEQYVPSEVQPPTAEEISADVQPLPAAETVAEDSPTELRFPPIEEAPAEKGPADVEPTLGEEALSELSAEVQSPKVEEAPVEVQLSSAEETPTEEAPAKVESIPTEEAFSEEGYIEVYPLSAEEPSTREASELQLPPAVEAPAEEAPAEVQPPPNEMSPEVQSPPIEETPVEEALDEIWSPPAEEGPTEEAPAEVQPPPAKEAPSEEAPAEVQPPPAEVQPPPAAEAPSEEAPAEVQPPSAEEAPSEEAPAEVQPSPAEEAPSEEAPAKVQPPPAAEAPSEEAPAEVQPPPAEEGPADEAPSGIWSPPTEEAPEEEAPDVWSPPAEEVPAEVQFPTAEEAPAEIWSPPAEEAPEEDTPAEVWSAPAGASLVELQHPSVEETTLEMVPVDKQFPAAQEDFITQFSIEDVLAEVQPPPSEHIAVNEALVDHMSTDYQYLQTTDVPVVKLESLVLGDQQKPEEPLELDPAPEDLSNIKREQVPAF
ncbi:fibrous sheath CABYR-binding protein [Ursus maritimus]|uniref:Fibrous sheath CABYR-binding protein n=1 Tax=Ursus maritimus TaxID=29073 RepID=A0A384CCR1_URSMA|nr:fibrous sheath CABYR-binding protein [Ursus maritimus]